MTTGRKSPSATVFHAVRENTRPECLLEFGTEPYLGVGRSSQIDIKLSNFKSSPSAEILDSVKLKAQNKINVTKQLELCSGRPRRIVGKAENSDYQNFRRLPQCFQNSFLSELGIVW